MSTKKNASVGSIRLLSERTDSGGESGAHGPSNSSPNMQSSKERVMLQLLSSTDI